MASNRRHADTIVHRPEQHEEMIIEITGLILAVLSLPFIVYAGDRTVRRIPRPEFVRSLSESMAGRLGRRRRDSTDSDATIRSAPNTPVTPSTHTLRRSQTNADRIGWVDTGFSISSGESYFRGVTLEKMGVD
jgi:hypothetical protein